MSFSSLPPSRREEPEEILHDLPEPWLVPSLVDWLIHYFRRQYHDGSVRYDVAAIRTLERVSRTPVGGGDDIDTYYAFKGKLESDRAFLLDATWYQVRQLDSHDDRAEKLDKALREGGSAWTVLKTGESWELVKRVEDAAKEAMQRALAEEDKASTYLRKAVVGAYGRDPDPSGAYHDAVRAVEAAAKETITPKDPKPSLGKMITAVRDAPRKWEAVLAARDADDIEVLLTMMKALWDSQFDRHGDDDKSTPAHIDNEAAEAAVHLAVTLVQWFRAGTVRRIG